MYNKKIDYFIDLCKKCDISDNDINAIKKEALNIIKNSKTNEKDITEIQKQADLWYKSLNTTDYAFYLYNTIIYLAEVWACWHIYSKKYLKNLFINKSLDSNKILFEDIGKINAVLDLGCGLGLTTSYLKEIFPEANVYGTNIKDSIQVRFAKFLSEEYKFNLIYDIPSINIDFIFASEYFEHFEKPIDHLQEIILKTNPKKLFIANSFNTRAVGHFNIYYFNNNPYTGKEMSRLFNNILRKLGYKKIKTNLWNNRPSYWIKQKNNTLF